MANDNKKRTTKGKPKSSRNGEYIVHQKISGNVRLLFYGGSKKSRDNSSFEFSAKNVSNDYKRTFPNDTIVMKFVDSAKKVVDKINEQKDGKIVSLDLFFHGTERGLYMYKGASLDPSKDFETEDIEKNNLNASLYASGIRKWLGDDKNEEVMDIYDIDFNKFKSQNAIIEIHGCKSGKDTDLLTDSISKNLSEELREGFIIGHTTKANPNINGTKILHKQDYRHGERVVWQNGEVVKKINKQGMIDVEDIKKKK